MSQQSPQPAYAPDTADLRREIVTNTTRHQFLGAGAGAGKTTVLVDHYFHLLAQGLRPAQVVAVTFTDKAAAEMKSRLREKCREQAGRSGEQADGVDWPALLHELEVAPISTIHGLCTRILRENALVAALDPDFTVLDEVDTQILLDEVGRQVLLSRLGQEPTTNALAVALGYEETVRNVTRLVQDRVKVEPVLADAAYGDVATLLARWTEFARRRLGEVVDGMLSSLAWVEALRVVTAAPDTPRAAECKLEARRRQVCGALRDTPLPPIGSTGEVEATANALSHLAEAMAAVGPAGNTGSKKDWGEEALTAMRAALRVFLNKDGLLQSTAAICRSLQGTPPEAETCAELTCALVAEVRVAREAFAAAKAERSALDFEDLMERTARLWAEHPEALARTRRGLRHVMIDEFQDTNDLQKRVLWPLVTGPAHASGPEGALPETGVRLFVVGDAKQSIYRFRNADVTVFNQARGEMAAAGARVDELTRNFRSTDSLIGVCNRLFGDAAIMGPAAAEPWQASYAAMQPERDDPPTGQSPLEVHLLAGDAAPTAEEDGEEEGGDLTGLRMAEAEWLANRLAVLLTTGEFQVCQGKGDQATWSAVRPGDIAVLLRSLTSVRLYEQALRRRGLPYYLVVGRGFFSAQEVQDVLNVLRALENSLDDIALVGALRSPLFGLSDETLYWLAQVGRGFWWWRLKTASADPAAPGYPEAGCHISPDQRARVQRAVALLEELRPRKNRLPLAALVQEIVDRTGFTAILAGQFGGTQQVSNVRKLVELAGEFEARRQAAGQGSLRDFVEHLKRLTTEEVRESQAPVEEEAGDSIKLITYHSAKGLQWPVVVAPDLCRKPGGGFPPPYRFHRELGLVVKSTPLRRDSGDGSYWPPLGQAIKDHHEAEEDAEARRLFYVAATRAQDLLILSGVTKLTTKGAVPEDAKKGPLGWLNLAFPQCLWQDAGNTPAETTWRWGGECLIPAAPAVADAVTTQHPAHAGPDLAVPSAQSLARLLEPVQAAATGQARFTATELSLYSHCPRLYELEHCLGLPGALPVFAGPSASGQLSPLELGTVVHRVLQLVGTEGPAELDRLVPANAAMLRLDTRLDQRAAAEAVTIRGQVQSFLGSELYRALFTRQSELRSEVSLTVPLEVDGRGVLVEGKIDALVRTGEGRWHLLDYKTGQEDPTKQAQYQVQLGLYCQAVALATAQAPASAHLVYLTRRGLSLVPLDIPEITAQALAAARQAVGGIWRRQFPSRPGQCQSCVARKRCEPGLGRVLRDEISADE